MKLFSAAITIIATFTSLFVFSQERVNKQTVTISNEVKGRLTKATGWMLSPEGEWVSRANRIPSRLRSEFKPIIDKGQHVQGVDNFISYELREVTVLDSTYYILIKLYKDGSFSDPIAETGWKSDTSVVYYVVTQSEFSKLNSVVDSSRNTLMLNVWEYRPINAESAKTYMADIKNYIQRKALGEKEADRGKFYLVFSLAPYKSKNLVQFQIYAYSMYGYVRGIVATPDVNGKTIYATDELFDHCYFETDYANFSKFIKLP